MFVTFTLQLRVFVLVGFVVLRKDKRKTLGLLFCCVYESCRGDKHGRCFMYECFTYHALILSPYYQRSHSKTGLTYQINCKIIMS